MKDLVYPELQQRIIAHNDSILITGAGGFIGLKLVEILLEYGYTNLRCFARQSSNLRALERLLSASNGSKSTILVGNLLNPEDCRDAVDGISVVYHLAAGVDKSFAGAVMNSVVATRNLLAAVSVQKTVKRFVNVSSFAVYSNIHMRRGSLLDERCEIDQDTVQRQEAYAYGKVKQDELVVDYAAKHNIPYVIIRPSVVFGPGKRFLPARVGIDTFGFFLHLGGPIIVPLTYVDNCAEAIALSGLVPGIEGEVFNVLDDNLPTSAQFLELYKRHVKSFRSIYIPYPLFYLLSYLWECYAKWSQNQLPPAFNRRRCSIYWKGNRYSNEKLKRRTGWKPRVDFQEALKRYFDYQKMAEGHHA